MTGPGKYDDLCTAIRQVAQASAVVVIVFEGKHGNGFSVQTESADLLQSLPKMLTVMAAEIQGDLDSSAAEKTS